MRFAARKNKRSLMKSDHAPYTRTAIALHWLMALPIIALLIFGLQTMGNHDGRLLPTVHASAGFLLLAAAAFRLFWRLKHPPPALPENTSKLEAGLARLIQIALYCAMFLIPLTGWLAFTEHVRRSFGVAPASFFGMAKIPLLPDFGINFHFIHKLGGKAALVLIGIHAAAALKHHFYGRDNALLRMLPWSRLKASATSET